MRIGKITENTLNRAVLKQLNTEYKLGKSAAVGSDCAFSDKKKTFSATYPLVANTDDAGYYAVCKVAGSLFSQGISPDQVLLSILLPETAEERSLRKIVGDAIAAARELGVMYSGGHTEVTSAVSRPLVTATCVGAEPYTDKGFELVNSKPKKGQALVVTKWIALEGTAIIAKEKYEELITRYPAPFIDDAAAFKAYMNIKKEAAAAIKSGVSAIHDISSGGIFAALWEMSQRAGTGLKVDLRKIPIRQETVEICDFFEINPYTLLSGGALLLATDDGDKLVRDLAEEGIYASEIGYLEEGNDKIIVNEDESRFLELPQADEIHKILG